VRDVRKPVIPLAVEEDPDHVLIFSDGTYRSSFNITLSPEDVGRIRAGYVCAICFEAHEEAYPEECSVCRFPMRSRQAEFVAKAYLGKKRIGPSTSLADELAAMEELEERYLREQTVSAPQIIVPGGF
jgi:hypothetical protein